MSLACLGSISLLFGYCWCV